MSTELFDLVAKLTLNSKEYERGLDDAEKQARKIDDIDATLSLDDSDFTEGIDAANSAHVNNLDSPELDLNDSDFNTGINNANEANVDDPDDPNLDLDDTDFTTGISEADAAEVNDPNTPNLGLDTTDFDNALAGAEENAGGFSSSLETIFENAGTVIKATGVALAIQTVVNGLSDIVNMTMEMGDRIDKGSQAMKISTDAYQEWSYVLDMNGASIDDFSRGVRTMSAFMTASADISKEASDAFAALGITAKKDAREITTTEELLYETIKALADFEGTNEDRGVFAEAIFGKNASVLNAMFNSGSESIDELIKKAHELGLVMTGEEVKNAADYNDAFTDMQNSITALKTSLVVELMPALTNIMNMAAKTFALFNWRTGDKPLSEQFEDIDNGAMDAFASIDTTQSVAMLLVDRLIAMGEASELTANKQAEWKGTAEELIKLIPSLSEYIDTDTLKINANTDAIKASITEWGNLGKARALQQAKEEKYIALINRNTDAINAQVEANVANAEAETARVKVIEELNPLLEAYGIQKLSQDSTRADISWAESLLRSKKPDDVSFNSQVSKITSVYQTAENNASAARQKAEDFQEQVEKGIVEYENFVKIADELFGIPAETAQEATEEVEELGEAIAALPDGKVIPITTPISYGALSGISNGIPHAKGLNYVPYDNYPADLHRGEMVLTSSQARDYREERNYNSSMDMSALSVEIANAIRSGMQGATVKSYLSGRDVTESVNRTTSQQLKARRFSP